MARRLPGPGEPLDRYLTRNGCGSWAWVHHLIHWGRVSVNGERCHRYHHRLAPGEVVTLDGVPIADTPDRCVLICHKPIGLACSHGAQDAPLIYDIVPEALQHPNLETVGRLDRNTSGLLLLTFDGKFLQRVVAPERKQPKRYRVGYSGTLVADSTDRAAAGMMIDGHETPCRPAELLIDPLDDDGLGRATVIISEGRHHQVKRMIAALGGHVERLHRDRIGGLDLPNDLEPGDMRIISPSERTALGAD